MWPHCRADPPRPTQAQLPSPAEGELAVWMRISASRSAGKWGEGCWEPSQETGDPAHSRPAWSLTSPLKQDGGFSPRGTPCSLLEKMFSPLPWAGFCSGALDMPRRPSWGANVTQVPPRPALPLGRLLMCPPQGGGPTGQQFGGCIREDWPRTPTFPSTGCPPCPCVPLTPHSRASRGWSALCGTRDGAPQALQEAGFGAFIAT